MLQSVSANSNLIPRAEMASPSGSGNKISDLFLQKLQPPPEPIKMPTRPWRDLASSPVEMGVGLMWGCFWMLEVICATANIFDLWAVLKEEGERSKIGEVARKSIVGLISFSGTTANTLLWAHEAKVIVMTGLTHVLKYIGYGASLITSGVETILLASDLYEDRKTILNDTDSTVRNKARDHLFYSFVKLIGSVTMVAFGALGVGGVLAGVAVSSTLTMSLLAVSSFFAILAYVYKGDIDDRLATA